MLQDKSAPAASEPAGMAPARKNWSPSEKRNYAVNMRAEGYKAADIAVKLGVSQQRVHQYVYEAEKRPKKGTKSKKARIEKVRHAGSFHRLALKVQRGTVAAMQSEVNDYLMDVLLLCQEILREG
jgi:predicted transcriptional regulator